MWVPYLQSSLRQKTMKELHEIMGHQRSPSIFQSLQVRWWWPGMEVEFKNYIAHCEICQISDPETRRLRHPKHALPNPGIPFHTWHIDWIQDLPESDGLSQIAVATDRATRTTFAKASSSRDGLASVKFLYE